MHIFVYSVGALYVILALKLISAGFKTKRLYFICIRVDFINRVLLCV